MGRQPCCDKIGLKRGPWTSDEDRKLASFIATHGHGCWREVPKLAGLLRCGKSCRLRWINYLRPDVKRGNLSEDEENLIILLHASIGSRWSRIAAQLPGRTDNEIKNCWNTRIKKKLKLMGIDPVTHRPLPQQSHHITEGPIKSEVARVNGPPSLGQVPMHKHLLNGTTHPGCHYNRIKSMQEAVNAPSPSSLVSPSTLSHKSTVCEDEHSHDSMCATEYSADSTPYPRMHIGSCKKGRGSSLHSKPPEYFGKSGLHNVPEVLPTCQLRASHVQPVSKVEDMGIPSLESFSSTNNDINSFPSMLPTFEQKKISAEDIKEEYENIGTLATNNSNHIIPHSSPTRMIHDYSQEVEDSQASMEFIEQSTTTSSFIQGGAQWSDLIVDSWDPEQQMMNPFLYDTLDSCNNNNGSLGPSNMQLWSDPMIPTLY